MINCKFLEFYEVRIDAKLNQTLNSLPKIKPMFSIGKITL